MVTATPPEHTHCPEQDPDYVIPEGVAWDDVLKIESDVVRLLTDGASLIQVSQSGESTGRFDYRDLTGDDIAELTVSAYPSMIVFGCREGEYAKLLDLEEGGGTFSYTPWVHSVQDMNANGIPEVVVVSVQGSGGNKSALIVEWNGNEFIRLIKADLGENSPETSAHARSLYWYEILSPELTGLDSSAPGMNGNASVEISDLDGNGTLELILSDNGPAHHDTVYNFGPWRGKEVVFEWDGLHFVFASYKIDPAEYRFQAVQDADRAFLTGQYEQAISLYRNVIFDDRLEWWSRERQTYIGEAYWARVGGETLAIPAPEPNPAEYPTLSAYASYRILLYWLVQGRLDDAELTYTEIAEGNPLGTPGYAYAEIATILWDSFQSTGDFPTACEGVVSYIKNNPDLLFFLEGGNTSIQSHHYEPFDICPFTWLAKLDN